MAIDKKIDYVEQDGSLNFVKNSESVTVPKKFKARKEAPATKLAYITDAEAKMLKKMKKGTPHKGPKGIPSYDSFGSIDASGKDTGRAGEDVSSAERGDFRGFEGSRNLPPGVQPKASDKAQALRSAFIAAGGGQRVNPGFFDSRNVVSPAELAAAKAFAPEAYKATRGGGIMDFITSGGFLGNIVRGLGQKFGLGKRYNEPTYDMSGYSTLGLGGTGQEGFGVPTQQGDYDVLGNKINEITGEITSPTGQSLGFLPGYPGSDTGGITTIPTGGDNDYTQNIVETINETVDDNVPGEDLLLRYLGADSTITPEAAGLTTAADVRDLQQQRAKNIFT